MEEEKEEEDRERWRRKDVGGEGRSHKSAVGPNGERCLVTERARTREGDCDRGKGSAREKEAIGVAESERVEGSARRGSGESAKGAAFN